MPYSRAKASAGEPVVRLPSVVLCEHGLDQVEQLAMLEFGAVAETSASPSEVLAGATDFSERRAQIYPNVKAGHFEVHSSDERSADATERLWPFGMWERSRYDWSQPGTLTGTVIESNVVVPGSTWTLTATPTEGGSRVETVFRRDFLSTARGRVGWVLNRLGSSFAGSDLKKMLREIERGTGRTRQS